jgi:serine/threonine protein kinase
MQMCVCDRLCIGVLSQWQRATGSQEGTCHQWQQVVVQGKQFLLTHRVCVCVCVCVCVQFQGIHIDCVRHYAAELVLALVQLRRHNIVHRDIKPENLLLSALHHAKLADFGSAIELPSSRGMHHHNTSNTVHCIECNPRSRFAFLHSSCQ